MNQLRPPIVAAMLVAAVWCAGCDPRSPTGDDRDERVAAVTASRTGPPGSAGAGQDFEPIRLADCAAFPPEAISSWSGGQPGTLTTTGRSRGYVYTRRQYGDFTLTLEYRFVRPESVREEAELDNRNTGLLVYVPDEHRIWPRSPEVQGRHDEMAGIKSNSPDLEVAVIEDNEAMRQLARRPVGEWNELTIVSRDGALETFLNGVKIAETLPGELKRGHIGFQSEGHEVHFRDVRIRAE